VLLYTDEAIATSTGTGDWVDAYTKAKRFVAKLTIKEKANITFGWEGLHGNWLENGCAGNSGSLLKHGFPGFCFHDGPGGLSGTDMVNGYPAGLHMATTWNRELVGTVARHMGLEFKKKGGNKT
jgi:beta-glucosidase